MDLYRILHECSCFIEFIKGVEEKIKCEACRSFYLFFATSLIVNKFNIRGAGMFDYISLYYIKIILKSYFWREKVFSFAICITFKASFHDFPENL